CALSRAEVLGSLLRVHATVVRVSGHARRRRRRGRRLRERVRRYEKQRRERERRWDSHDGLLPRSCFAAHRRADAAARQLGDALATLARSFYTRATNELAQGGS